MGKKIEINHNSEFELDLAPLLAVMVKLVPVLLVSSAFVQFMVIETQLPQAVKDAIEQQEKNAAQNSLVVEIDEQKGFLIKFTHGTDQEEVLVPTKDNHLDFAALQTKLQSLKTRAPEMFKMELAPQGETSYDSIVKTMDEARRTRDTNQNFQFQDPKSGKNVSTQYMYPEVVFINTFEG